MMDGTLLALRFLFFPRNHVQDLAELMADSAQVEALIVSLEKSTAKQPASKEIRP